MERITSDYGIQLRMNRSIQAEGSFANVKEDMGFQMLAIQSEIDAWREKKDSEQANARYNEILNYGLEDL